MSIDIKEAAHRLGKSEKTLRRWVHTGKIPYHPDDTGRLMFDVSDIEAHQVAPSDTQRIEALERRIEELERKVERLESRPLTRTLRPPRIPYETSPQPAPAQPAGRKSTMPEGLVGWRAFSRRHQVGESTTQNAIESGRLSIVPGTWIVGRARVQGALDAAGRAKFYELYHNKPQFKLCDECPHML